MWDQNQQLSYKMCCPSVGVCIHVQYHLRRHISTCYSGEVYHGLFAFASMSQALPSSRAHAHALSPM